MAAGFACHIGLVLDFGTGTGRDAVRAMVRSLLGLDLTSDAEAARAAAERAPANGLVPADDADFLNDLLDLPLRTMVRHHQPMVEAKIERTLAEDEQTAIKAND